jgi:excisionase family DNA binding protein
MEDMQMMGKAQEMPTARRRLITFKESLTHLRVGRTKAYELINSGKIIAYKQGHQTMIDADSIDAYQAALPRIAPGSLKLTRGRRPS